MFAVDRKNSYNKLGGLEFSDMSNMALQMLTFFDKIFPTCCRITVWSACLGTASASLR